MTTQRSLCSKLLLVVVALVHGASRAAAQDPPPTLAAASARLQANDAAGAAAILVALTEREPRNGPAWRSLARAYQMLKDYDGAAGALSCSLEVDPQDPTPLYALGVVRALQGETDEAFEWLMRARASHQIDMAQVDFDPALSGLRADPRFAGLHHAAEDFAQPFVEPVQVLREWHGEAANDQFGWIARNIGDVDGDGVPDVVTSAPSRGAGASASGRVYVYSTKSGKLLWTADGRAGDQLGLGIEGAGDTNRDGIPDVIAAAPGGGQAFVYSGRDGRVLLTLSAEQPGDQFGRHVAGAGDVDRDGHADVIVGAPGSSAVGPGAGRAYVFSGQDGRALLVLSGEKAQDAFGSTVAGYASEEQLLLVVGAGGGGPQGTGRAYVYDALSSSPKFTIDSDATGRALASMFVSVPGDVDGDGTPDVYASDWQNAARGPQTGRVYVHSGKDGRRLLTLTGERQNDGFGSSPAVAGDVDGDGHADLIVGAWQHGSGAHAAGRAYLHSGADGRLLATYTCRTPGDTFGFDAVTMGDVDRDGTSDFLITSAWSGVRGYHSGRVFIVSSGIRPTAR